MKQTTETSQEILIKTSLFHQGFTLLGRSSMTFAVLLIILYSTSFWFSYNASYFGLLAILISLAVTHCLLRGLESKLLCRLLSFFLKGKPAVVYSRWLKLEENRLTFGTYRLLYSTIDNVSLSLFGNLIFKSNALSGPLKRGEVNAASIVLKMPFSAIDLQAQKKFITLLKEKCPQAIIAPSLATIQDKPILKSTTYIHTLSLIIFILILFDIGNSTFGYIELLKRYYLSQKAAAEQNIDQAKKAYESAQSLKAHFNSFSLVTPKLLNDSSTAANLFECRSKALWGIGNREESLAAQVEAAKLVPKSFKINLRLARLYAKLGQTEKAKESIEGFSDKHKHSLLPHLYTAALLLNDQKAGEAKSVLKDYLAFLDKDYFSPPPVWPPAGEDSIHELFVRDDLEFLLSNLEASPNQKRK